MTTSNGVKFNYQARSPKGDIQTGVVEASSRETALNLLQKYRLFVTFLERADERPFYARKVKLFERISKKDIVNFSRQLAMMSSSKIPLVQSFQSIAEQTKNPSFKEKIVSLSQEVEGGTPLSQALADYPKLFSSFYVNMVKSGEASGTLSESFTYLADHLEREYHLLSKVRGAMIYPALIVVVVIGVLIMMMYFVIPNMVKVLTETDQELPLVTKAVIALSNFFRSWGWLAFLIIFGMIIGALRFFKLPQGKRIKDRLMLRIPLIGSFLKMIYLTRFAENLSTLVAGGLPIAQSLEITGSIVGNDVYQTIVFQIRDEVRKGEKISRTLAKYPDRFPSMLVQMVTIGEQTGTLDKSLMNVVDFYRRELERSIDTILSVLEPIMVIFLGGLVAGLMGAVLLPLYKMTNL